MRAGAKVLKRECTMCAWKIGYNRTNKGFLRTLHLRNIPFKKIKIMARMGILRIFAYEETPSLALLAGK